MLQSSRLEDHMKTIGIDQSLCTRSSFEHKCMNNINLEKQDTGKCDDQQNLKDIIDSDLVSNTEGVTDNSPNVTMASLQCSGHIYTPSFDTIKQYTTYCTC